MSDRTWSGPLLRAPCLALVVLALGSASARALATDEGDGAGDGDGGPAMKESRDGAGSRPGQDRKADASGLGADREVQSVPANRQGEAARLARTAYLGERDEQELKPQPALPEPSRTLDGSAVPAAAPAMRAEPPPD